MLKVVDRLNALRQYVLANQLVRSGTAIGALIAEAQQAESRLDFIHKMKIAAKEADETDYWLSIIRNVVEVEEEILEELKAIRLIVFKIIISAKKV